MKNAKEQESVDPLCNPSDSSSEPCVEDLQKSSDTSDRDSDVDVTVAQKKTTKKRKHKKASKRLHSGKKSQKLTRKAEKLMSVGLKDAKLHMKFLKQSAQSQDMDLSSSSEDCSDTGHDDD